MFHTSCDRAFSVPSFLHVIIPQKKGRENWVYFRFFSAKKLTAPIAHATATAMIMASSVVINGVSGVSASGVSGVTGVSGVSGSTGVEAETAGPTVTAVPAAELP